MDGLEIESRFRLVLQELATTNLRPHLVLWSETQHVLYFMDLAVPWEDVI